MHPLNIRIYAAMDLVERHGMPLTVEAVRVNALKEVKWSDFSVEDAINESVDNRIRRCMKTRGKIIADATTRERRDFWGCSIEELEEQLRIKEQSSRYDQNRLLADRAVLKFLRERQKEFGYAVCPDLFHVEIDRIYAMHGFGSPGEGREAA